MTLQRVRVSSVRLPLHAEAASRRIECALAAGLPPHTLMRRAGLAVARLAQALAPHAQRVWVAAGPGNNGGDGLEAAALLQRAGFAVQLTLAADPARLPPDAAASLQRARDAGLAIDVVAADGEVAPPALAASDIAIDALLGLGATRAPAGALGVLVHRLNALPCAVLAVDLPSGLNAGNGQAAGGVAVRATHTLSLLTLKPGLFTGTGRQCAGEVWFDDIGVDNIHAVDAGHAPDAWLCGHDAAVQPRRSAASHKGSFGDVAVVAGAPGMTGAALLAACAAHAAGAGRVFVERLTPQAEPLDALHPELMFRAGWSQSPADVLAATTVVCGPGGGDAVRAVLPRLLGETRRLVLDADALNAIAADIALQTALRARAARGAVSVLTPHPLEAARLLACSTAGVQADRLQAAQRLAERFQCIVVLKGSGSVIAAPSRVPCVNATGNASLASAGTGDVLAGWLAGSWAQAEAGEDAAFAVTCRAVAAHGAAAEPERPGALRASDLIEQLHRRLREGA